MLGMPIIISVLLKMRKQLVIQMLDAKLFTTITVTMAKPVLTFAEVAQLTGAARGLVFMRKVTLGIL